MPTTDRIALIGLRGTGKTTVGRLVAAELGWRSVDVDEEIETLMGWSIAEFFKNAGEAAFRDTESQIIDWQCSNDRLVLATGGGAVLRPANRERLQTCGMVAWLTAPPGVLWERTQADPATAARRPNLTAAGGLAEVEQLLAAREPLYRETATHTFDTVGKSPADVAAEIVHEWRRQGERPG